MLSIGLGAGRGEGNAMKLMMAAAAAALSLGATAHANTYDLGTLSDTSTSTSSTLVYHNSTSAPASYTDTFTFNIVGDSTEFSSGAFNESTHAVGGKTYAITDFDLTLYAAGNATPITSISYDPKTTVAETLQADLSAGSYYLTSTITVPGHDYGSYSVNATTTMSAAPEPATWLLMFAGLGLAGGMLRYNRRNTNVMAVAA